MPDEERGKDTLPFPMSGFTRIIRCVKVLAFDFASRRLHGVLTASVDLRRWRCAYHQQSQALALMIVWAWVPSLGSPVSKWLPVISAPPFLLLS